MNTHYYRFFFQQILLGILSQIDRAKSMVENTHRQRCAIVFMRAPQIGKVKTRLCGFLGEETVLALYKNFARDVIETVRKQTDHIRIFYYPSGQAEGMRAWLGNAFKYVPQTGKNLGERMENAFGETFSEGILNLILIGTDIPDLPEAVVREAFDHLENRRAVIGPASDGGYYLVGFPKDMFVPQIFKDMPWGTDQVFNKTLRVLRQARRFVHLLPKWRDIDDYDDLLDFIAESRSGQSVARNTVACLKRYELI